MKRQIWICCVLLGTWLAIGNAAADSTNSTFGITFSYPDSFALRQQDAPTKTITLESKSGDRIVVGIFPAAMQPEDLLTGITIPAFRRGRSLRKIKGPLSEQEVTRKFFGAQEKGIQFKEVLPSGVLYSEFHCFKRGSRIFLVTLQWHKNTEANLPPEIKAIIDSMKE